MTVVRRGEREVVRAEAEPALVERRLCLAGGAAAVDRRVLHEQARVVRREGDRARRRVQERAAGVGARAAVHAAPDLHRAGERGAVVHRGPRVDVAGNVLRVGEVEDVRVGVAHDRRLPGSTGGVGGAGAVVERDDGAGGAARLVLQHLAVVEDVRRRVVPDHVEDAGRAGGHRRERAVAHVAEDVRRTGRGGGGGEQRSRDREGGEEALPGRHHGP